MTPRVDASVFVHAARELRATFATLVREGDAEWDLRLVDDRITAQSEAGGAFLWLRAPDAPACKAHCVLVVRNGQAHMRRLSITDLT
jgi:hypothetical protein